MNKDRYKEIKERNNNPLLLCFEVFHEQSKSNIGVQEFKHLLSEWVILQQPDVFIMGGGNRQRCYEVGLERIVKFLDEKYA